MEEFLSYCFDKAYALGGKAVGGRLWKLKAAALGVFLAVFMSFPSYGDLNRHRAEWRPVLDKIEHPFVQQDYRDNSHESKFTFRLVVPILGHLLGFRLLGCLAAQALAGVALIYLAVHLGYGLTRDRVMALFTGLTVASIWPGITGFVELRPMMDSVSLAFLIGAMAARNAFPIAGCVFLSAWSDERGLIASSLVFLYQGLAGDRPQGARFGFTPTAGHIGVAGGWAAYFACRWAACHFFHLRTNTGGLGLHTLIDQINMLPMGVWSGLEGGWLLVGASVILLGRARAWTFLAAFVGALSLVVFVAMSVTDVTRSMAFCLPALFLSLKAASLLEEPGTLKRIVLLVLAVSFLWPNYYCDADRYIWWYYPLPLEVLRNLLR